jgi:hypothetical protein
MNLDELVNSIPEKEHRERLSNWVRDWKKDSSDIEALGELIEKWHGNVWFNSQQHQNEFYEEFIKFKSVAISGVGGMSVNERLYWFGLFEEWDSSDQEDHLRIRGKVHAHA